MGLLEDYAPDLEQIEVPSWDVPDGIYPFVIGSAAVIVGTRKEPDAVHFVFKFLLGETGKPKDEWFRLPDNPSAPTDKEKEKLGYLKGRFLSLGIPESEINSVTEDDLVGIEGTLTLLTKNGYQNIRSLTLEDDGENAFQKPAIATPVEAATPVAPKPRRTRRTKEQIAADAAAAEAVNAGAPSAAPAVAQPEAAPVAATLSDEEIEAQLEAEEAALAAAGHAEAPASAAPAASPVEAIEESDADRKARIIARRKARAAEAAASAPASASDNPFGA